MPNRILRDGILTSERVAKLSWPAEVFFRRLMSGVDDFGRYYAKPELIRAAAYPLAVDKVGNSDIGKWLAECAGAALVRTYTVDGKSYLELLDFRQQKRAQQSKFPPPPDECVADVKQMRSNGVATAHLDVCEGEVVCEGEKHIAPRKKPRVTFSLPDWLEKDRDVWDAWVEARTKSKHPPTDWAKSLAVAKLEHLREQGHNPRRLLADAAFHNWRTFYPAKDSA